MPGQASASPSLSDTRNSAQGTDRKRSGGHALGWWDGLHGACVQRCAAGWWPVGREHACDERSWMRGAGGYEPGPSFAPEMLTDLLIGGHVLRLGRGAWSETLCRRSTLLRSASWRSRRQHDGRRECDLGVRAPTRQASDATPRWLFPRYRRGRERVRRRLAASAHPTGYPLVRADQLRAVHA